MATFFVNSAAAGANNGTTEADAWTSLTSAVGVAAGSVIWMEDGHNQNPGAGGSYNFSNGTAAAPIILYSVNFSNDTYTPAAAANFSGALSDITISGHVRMYGWNFGVADDLSLTGNSQYFEDCVFNMAGGDDVIISALAMRFVDCSFTLAAGSEMTIVGNNAAIVSFKNCTFPSGVGSFTLGAEGGTLVFEDCDISAYTSFYATIGSGWTVILRRCKVHASLAFATTISVPECFGQMESCDDGTITVPALGLNKYASFYGTVSSDLTRYRTGGADDGLQANEYSWGMTANTNALEAQNPVQTPPMTVWADPDASISGATARGLFQSTRVAPLGTPAALTTDGTSTWNGSNVGTKQKIDVSLSNGKTLTVYVASDGTLNNDDFWIEVSEPDQVGGPVTVVCYLAKPSTTVYVDPKIEISDAVSTHQWFSNGVQFNGPEEGAGGGGGIIRPVGLTGGLV